MKKLLKFGFVKSIDVENRLVRAYVSDFKWDRDGERFAKGAWVLDNFNKNPVVLFAHDHWNLPVGKCVELLEDDNGLLAVTQFADTEEGNKIFTLYKDGFMNAFSVGFIPREIAYEDVEKDRRGRVFTRAELLEYSAVPVPANPGACVTHAQADLIKKTFGESYVRQEGEKFFLTDGKAAAAQPPAAPAPVKVLIVDDSFDDSLKQIIDLAKAVKFKPTDEGKLKLAKSAISVLQEIVQECEKEEVTKEEFDQLKSTVEGFGNCVKALYPSKEDLVKAVQSQLEKAFNKGPAQE